MRLEKIYNRPLSSSEEVYKKAYLDSDKKIWEKPMTFSEYNQGVEEGILVQTPISGFYREKTVDQRGITNKDMERDFNAGVILHCRYSYPVLHNHDYVEIVYVASGSCLNLFRDSSFEMREGDVCILSPNSFHAVSCTSDESCILNIVVSLGFFGQKFLEILRGGKLVSEFLENILYKRSSTPYVLFRTGKDEWLHDLAARLLTEEIQKPYAYDYSISLLASEFLLHVSRDYEMMAIVPNAQSDTQNSLIVSVLGYLSVNYNRSTLAQTAVFFGYSAAYLSRLIKENTGKNYNQIITELQMTKAAELIKSGEASLTDVALEVGCFDSSHFNKKFKSVYGISPRDYVKKLHNI